MQWIARPPSSEDISDDGEFLLMADPNEENFQVVANIWYRPTVQRAKNRAEFANI